MYAITAIINRTGIDKTKAFPNGWESSRPLPTFYLDERVQGLLSPEAACRIALDIVLPFGETADMTASITAVRVPGPDTAPAPAPTLEEAILKVRLKDPTKSPAQWLASEQEQLEVTWDEDPTMVAGGRYYIEGATSVLIPWLERAVWEGGLVEYSWRAVN